MTEELESLLIELIQDLKDYQPILIIIVNSIVALVSVGVGYLIHKRLVKIKAEQDLIVKRFEKYHDLQISAIKLLYPLIVKLDFASEQLQNPFVFRDPKLEIAERMATWINSFNELSIAYYHSDLYLDKEISQFIKEYIDLHKNLYFRFSENRRTIEEFQIAKSDSDSGDEMIRGARDDLRKSAKELKEVKLEFEIKNSKISELMKRKFITMLKPKE